MGDYSGLPPLIQRPGSGGAGSVMFSRYQPSIFGAGDHGDAFSIIGHDLFSAPELPEFIELLTRGIPSRLTLADMIGSCRTTVHDIERLPAIHPSVMSSRGEQQTRYMSFVSTPPIERRPPKGRPRFPRKPLGPAECYKCQLKTDHASCEKHKYLRIGGGYRHSYAYISQIMDVIEKEHFAVARDEFLKHEKIKEEARKLEESRNTVKRRMKLYLRTTSGNVITRYQFVNEDDYREIKENKTAAKKMLGLNDDESLEEFVTSKQDYVQDRDGEMVKAKRKKLKKKKKHRDGDENESEDDFDDDEKDDEGRGRHGRKKEHRSKRHRKHKGRRRRGNASDDESIAESGVGASIHDGDASGKYRRHRLRHNSGDVGEEDDDQDITSADSYISDNGTLHHREKKREKKHRRHDRDDVDGDRHRGRRRRDRDDDSVVNDVSGESDAMSYDGLEDETRHRRGRGKRHHRGKRRGTDNSDSEVDDDGARRRRKGHQRRRGRRSDDEDDGDMDDDRHVKGGRRGGGRHRTEGGRRRKHGSSEDSSESDDRSDGGDRRGRRRGRRRNSDVRKGDNNDVYHESDKHHRRRRRKIHSDDVSDEESRAGEDRRSRRHGYDRHHGFKGKQRRRLRRNDVDSDDDDDDDDDDDGRRGHRKRYSNDDDDDYYGAYSRRSAGRRSKKHGGRTKEKGHRSKKKRSGDESSCESESSDEYSSESSDGSRSPRRRDKKRGKGQRGGKSGKGRKEESDESGSSSYDSSYDSSCDSSSSDDSDESSSSSSSSDITSESSEVSDASDVSSIQSDDISDVGSELKGEDRARAIREKKRERKEDNAMEKQLKKFQDRKKERENKKEKTRKTREEKIEKNTVKKENRREDKNERQDAKRDKGKGKIGSKGESSSSEEETDSDDGTSRKKDRRNRRDKRRDRPFSAVSTVGTVQSDEISLVDSALSDGEKRKLKAQKKEKLKQKKTDHKQQAKVDESKREGKQKKKEKEKKRIKRDIDREMARMSSASSASSVHSSVLSLGEDDKGLDEDAKNKKKATLKRKLTKAKQKSKNFMKAVSKVMEKRSREGHDDPLSSDDGRSTKGVSFADLVDGKEFKSLVDYTKGGKRGLTDKIEKTDGRGMDWMTEWKLLKEKQEKKEQIKLKKAEEMDDPLAEYRNIIKAERDARKDKVSKLKLFINRNMGILKGGTVRIKTDGTLAADDDSDAETIDVDDDGNMKTLPTSLRYEDTDLKEWITDMDMSRGSKPMVLSDDEAVGVRRVLKVFRRHPEEMNAHLQRVLKTASELKADEQNNRQVLSSKSARAVDERETTIDYMNHYRLVEKSKLDPMARSFTVEDKDRTCVLTLDAMREALNGVPSLSSLKTKQLEYVLKVLDLDDHSRITFKMFAVIGAICDRMSAMDAIGQELIDKSDLLDIQRKMDLYNSMFYCNVNSERDDNYVTVETLRIELKAGGLNRTQEDYIISKMNPSEYNTVSFLDYMAYIPLFLSMHDNIIDNPFDFAEKYNKPSTHIQRDMNPIGLPLKRTYHTLHKSMLSRGLTSSSRTSGPPNRTSTKLPNIISRISGLNLRPQPPNSASRGQKP